mmetsp:Transcript_9059/g.20558  ORF Transcript_9059/g.20558 Transcript_9059/m.20558 type:complete len:267 (-) Transcript_9059:1016-1816(-)
MRETALCQKSRSKAPTFAMSSPITCVLQRSIMRSAAPFIIMTRPEPPSLCTVAMNLCSDSNGMIPSFGLSSFRSFRLSMPAFLAAVRIATSVGMPAASQRSFLPAVTVFFTRLELLHSAPTVSISLMKRCCCSETGFSSATAGSDDGPPVLLLLLLLITKKSPFGSYPTPVTRNRLAAVCIFTTVISFFVSVPVLSLFITVRLPSVSTHGSLRMMAFCLAMEDTPSASAMVTTAGKPSGMMATATAMAFLKASCHTVLPSPLHTVE